MSFKALNIREKERGSYFREIQNELKKVNWTTKGELIFSTKTVVYSILFFGVGVYLVDLVVRETLNILDFVLRLIFK